MNYILWILLIAAILGALAYLRSFVKKVPFFQSLRDMLSWVWGKVGGFLIDILKPLFQKQAVQIAATILGTWILAFFTTQATSGPPEPKDYSNELKALNNRITQMQLNALTKDEFKLAKDEMLAHSDPEVRAKLKAIEDSLGRQGERINSLSLGSGEVKITGMAEVTDSSVSDNWIDGYVQGLPKPLAVKPVLVYEFTFKIKDIDAQFVDEGGRIRNVYSVWLQSTKDTNKVLYVGNYVKYKAIELVSIDPLKGQKWFWSDWTLSGHAVIAPRFEAGLSVSPFTWSRGGLAANDVLVRLPRLGASSNFDGSSHVFAAVGLNLGPWLPLLADTYIDIGYAIGSTNAVLIGISTSL